MTPDRQLEILTRTRNLISHPSKWGRLMFVTPPTMVDRLLMRQPRLCLVGAISQAVTGSANDWSAEVTDVCSYLASFIDTTGYSYTAVMKWNDVHTHAEVLALLDLAILDTQLGSAPADEEQNQSNDRENQEDCPQHGADSTRWQR
jgi:hypothetical protein